MKEFRCSKCNSSDVFINVSGNNTGLYCGDCGKWITWLNKDQLRLAERQIANRRGEALKNSCETLSESSIDEVSEACRQLGVNIKDNNGNYKSIYEVLTELSVVFNIK